jgi:diaminohydroxyphosphoribosylaminopyrimidine deaminase / 5-amino-6-(5-phosphoribosylamino)uracil reductase
MSVTLKLATSLDGRIATATGESRWITGEAARERVHRLRAEHDAVVVGIETVLADDPELTVRLKGPPSSFDRLRMRATPAVSESLTLSLSKGEAFSHPARVVLDSRQRLPLDSKLARTARETPTMVVSLDPGRRELEGAGVQVVQVEAAGERPDVHATVRALAALGLRRLFVEGGGQVAASFIRCGLVERLEWFRAPIVLGGEGRPGVGALALTALAEAPRFRRVAVEMLGEDLWESYAR